MKIYFAADHAGFDLKNVLIAHVRALGYEVEDLGANTLDPQDDYPDYVTPCAERVAAEPDARGIIIGGSGEGEAMAANRIKGVRAALYYGGSQEIVTLAREHNNANIISFGARFVIADEAKRATELFLKTPFSGDERHVRRLAKF